MALLAPTFTDCVVALGHLDEDNSTSWIASGFLYGHEVTGRGILTFLITCRHVLEGVDVLCVRFNEQADPTDPSTHEYRLPIVDPTSKEPTWLAPADPSIDVAAIPFPAPRLAKDSIEFAYFSDIDVADRQRAASLGVTEGDLVYVLGFPMGLVGTERNYVITRIGCIARIRDVLHGTSNQFLIDAKVFPGNSGGPVVSRPEMMSIEGTKAVPSAHLLGVVTEYIAYRDVAVSERTGHARVTFEENSGLAAVVPIDQIIPVIAEWTTAQVSKWSNTPVAEPKEAAEQ